jgi:hypothetical protein
MTYTVPLPTGARYSLLAPGTSEGAETQPDCYRKVWPRSYVQAALRQQHTTERMTPTLWRLSKSKRTASR